MPAKPMRANMRIMKKQKDEAVPTEEHELLDHYTFDYSKAKPNRFAGRINEESVMVVLEPNVAVVFNTPIFDRGGQ